MLEYFPEADSGVLSPWSTKIYPAVYNGSHPYTDAFGRLMLAISEFTFTCHAFWTTLYLGSQIGKDAYSYLFSVPPGIHTLDVCYTYFVNHTSLLTNETMAEYLQGYITSFAQDGDPNKVNLPAFPAYGTSFVDLNINQTFINTTIDPAATSRCDWWKTALLTGYHSS